MGLPREPRRAADQPRRRHRLHLADEPRDARVRAAGGRRSAWRRSPSQAIANAALYRQLDDNLRRMALVSESALELTSSLDLQATLLTTARRLCEGVGVERVRDHRDRGRRAAHADARAATARSTRRGWAAAGARRRRRDARGDRDEAAGGGRVAARPAAHAGRARDQQGLRAQELGDAAADRQGPRDRHRGAGRERRRAHVHAGGARHGGGDLPRRRARHRQRRALRARAADDARDAAAQRHRGADGRQPRPRRGRQGGRRRARAADDVRRTTACCCSRATAVGRVIASRPQAEALVGARPRRLRARASSSASRAQGVLVRAAARRPARARRARRPSRASPRRRHRAALRHRPPRRARPEQRRPGRLRRRRPPPARARRHAALPGDQERPALRRDQADAPRQPQGAELGAQRQGLLHPGPRRPRGRLHGHARAGSWAGRRTCWRRWRRPPTCTTSARSASPTACCSSRAA